MYMRISTLKVYRAARASVSLARSERRKTIIILPTPTFLIDTRIMEPERMRMYQEQDGLVKAGEQ